MVVAKPLAPVVYFGRYMKGIPMSPNDPYPPAMDVEAFARWVDLDSLEGEKSIVIELS